MRTQSSNRPKDKLAEGEFQLVCLMDRFESPLRLLPSLVDGSQRQALKIDPASSAAPRAAPLQQLV